MMNIKNLFSTIGFVVLAAVGVSLFLKLSEKDTQLADYKKKFDTYQETVVTPALQKSAEAVRLADSAKLVADELKKKSQNQTVTINTLKKDADVLNKSNKQLKDSLLSHLTDEQKEICSSLVVLTNNQETEILKKDSIITVQDARHVTDSTSIESLNFSVSKLRNNTDSLTNVINKFPVPKPNNKILGFIPRPGPRTMFVAGIISTIVVQEVWKDKTQKKNDDNK
jgi:hypothetical protein